MENFEALRDLLLKDRSIRRYKEELRIDRHDLEEIVSLCRLCPSARNLQPLKYFVASDGELCEKIFPLLGWAGYYKDWSGPEKGERPAAYLIQCIDTELTQNADIDSGIQLEAITLGASAKGLGSCIIKCFNADTLSGALALPSHLRPLHVISLGYPAEKAEITDLNEDGDYKYFRRGDIQCVPKRSTESIIINNK